jgi:predicted  nucleic acid-binding Zn-ribbon protein
MAKRTKSAVTLNSLDAKLNRVIDRMDDLATKDDIRALDKRITTLEETTRKLVDSVEKLVKLVTDLQMEYAAIKMQLTRYDRWFKQIAEKTGIDLK